MRRQKSRNRPTSAALSKVLRLANEEIFEFRGALCVGNRRLAVRLLATERDLIEFEAVIQHVHPADCFAVDERPVSRTSAMEVGRIVMRSWAWQMYPLLKGRTVLFYLGGRTGQDVTLRFHIDRPGQHPLMDRDEPTQRLFKMEFYRLDQGGLRPELFVSPVPTAESSGS